MEEYKYKFTPAQLKRLSKSALIGHIPEDFNKPLDWNDPIPAAVDAAFGDGIIDIFKDQFEKSRPTPPEGLTEEEFFMWLDEAFFAFVTNEVNGIKERQELIKLLSSELKKHTEAPKLNDLLSNLEIKKDDKGKNVYSVIDPEKEGSDILDKCLGKLQKKRRARTALIRQKEQNEVLGNSVEGEVITYNNTSEIKQPTTKLFYEFYSCMPSVTEIDGQMCMNLNYGSEGKIIPLTASYKFPEGTKEEDKKIIHSSYAAFVGLSLNNLFLEGNFRVTPTKILQEMGIDYGNPNNIKKLMGILELGMGTITEIDNREVLKAWKKNNSEYQTIKTPIFPIMIKSDVSMVRGRVTKTQIQINGLSPFFIVGNEINQMTQWDKRLLKLYRGNRTERYYKVMLYLMRRIAWARNDKDAPLTITLDDVYLSCGDKSDTPKKKTKKMLWDLLEGVFLPLDYIYRVKEDPLTGSISFKVHSDRNPNEAAIKKKSLAKNRTNH